MYACVRGELIVIVVAPYATTNIMLETMATARMELQSLLEIMINAPKESET